MYPSGRPTTLPRVRQTATARQRQRAIDKWPVPAAVPDRVMTFGGVYVPSECRQIAPEPVRLEEIESLINVSMIEGRSERRHPLVDNVLANSSIHCQGSVYSVR